MCLNHTCSNRLKCYRYTAKANPYWQSYSDFRPNKEGVCEDFTNNKGYINEPSVLMKDCNKG